MQSDKDSANLYFELLDKSNEDYRLNHALSYVLMEKIRTYRWIDMDYLADVNVNKTIHNFSKVGVIFICMHSK